MNKSILVTGASGGIGRAICQRLAKGNRIAMAGRNRRQLNETAKLVEQSGGEAYAIEVDLSLEEAPEYLIAEATAQLGALDILINNAGAAIQHKAEDSSMADWNYLFNINARAAFFICLKALPYLKQSKSPQVVNISSVTGRIAYPYQSIYSASKHALHGWTKALAKEWKSYGIRIHLLAPGGVATPMVRTMRPDLDESGLIQPDEIADIIHFLIERKGSAELGEINIRRANSDPWKS